MPSRQHSRFDHPVGSPGGNQVLPNLGFAPFPAWSTRQNPEDADESGDNTCLGIAPLFALRLRPPGRGRLHRMNPVWITCGGAVVTAVVAVAGGYLVRGTTAVPASIVRS